MMEMGAREKRRKPVLFFAKVCDKKIMLELSALSKETDVVVCVPPEAGRRAARPKMGRGLSTSAPVGPSLAGSATAMAAALEDLALDVVDLLRQLLSVWGEEQVVVGEVGRVPRE